MLVGQDSACPELVEWEPTKDFSENRANQTRRVPRAAAA